LRVIPYTYEIEIKIMTAYLRDSIICHHDCILKRLDYLSIVPHNNAYYEYIDIKDSMSLKH